MMEVFSEIMTLKEIAKYLKIGKSTLYKMAREGKIPAVKIGFREERQGSYLGFFKSKIRTKKIV